MKVLNYAMKLYVRLLTFYHKSLYPKKVKKSANLAFKHVFNRNINWENPQNLIEKIYWLQLNTDTSLWTLCADKYKMREYVQRKGFASYLPELYGHWYNVESIRFDNLPSEYVLKVNNGCGENVFVKKDADISKIKRIISQWMNHPFGYIGMQLHYLRIQPCIIAEELLIQDEEQKKLSPNSLIDYKVWCINGLPESIWVAYNRHDSLKVNMALFDTNWNPMPQFLKNTRNDIYNPNVTIPKPSCLNFMLDMAKTLAEPFPEVRIDFYIIGNKPIIGEFTFSTGYGYFTDEYYLYLGGKMVIS